MSKLLRLLLILTCLQGTLALADQDYVSLNGGFYITYPDDWKQVDYAMVDYLLQQSGASAETFDYEVVLAEDKPGLFHRYQYLIITLEPDSLPAQEMKDSALDETAEGIEGTRSERSLVDDLGSVGPDEVVIDRSQNLLAYRTELGAGTDEARWHLYVLKAYDSGLVNFLFYCPDSVYAEAVGQYQNIVHSFSTEDVEAHLASEQVTLADPDRITGDTEGLSTGAWTAIFASAGILILVLAARAVGRRRRTQ